jgi:hypothetical protein
LRAANSLSLRFESYHTRMKEIVRRSTTSVRFRRSLGDVRREFMHRLFVVLHRTLASFLRGVLHEGVACDVASLPAPRA